MKEYLQFVTIDVWTMIFTWVNLIILFLLLKKFLFNPVNKILSDRAEEIERAYRAAEDTGLEADRFKSEYEKKLADAKTEADGIIKTAVEKANMRSDEIVTEANESAKRLMKKSIAQIERDKKNAVDEARAEIVSIAVDAAEKIIGRHFSGDDDDELISSIIDRI